ncbi:MAG TPA: polysaccharide biosynthesis C-terminal domain-containing protein, partial [Gaiellaceae bacterium]|nr:polysaccharide biosynthesis C-terminal domain-containing protein [Gaiellaceae bacterium]
IPRYGMMAAAFATLAAYATMFVGMVWWARRVFPVSWQWRRVLTAVGIGVATVAVGKLAGAGLVVALVLSLAYPLVLGLTGFYLPAERRKMLARLRPAR